MSDPVLPPSIAAELADIRRRLAALERSPQLPFSSTKGGKFVFLDDTGADRFALGNIEVPVSPSGGAGPKYGVFAYGDGGALALAVREGNRGLAYPTIPTWIANLNATQDTSSTSFTDVGWGAFVDTPAHEVYVAHLLANSTGGTGQVRLRDVVSGSTTAAANVGAGSHGVRFEWLHPAVCGWGDTRAGRDRRFVLRVQAKAPGGGSISVSHPDESYLAGLDFVPTAATDGNPQVS